jgi:hypothetical protein
MIIIKANEKSEAGVMPSERAITEMGAYNEEMAKAGVMLAAEGLHPSSRGARVRSVNGKLSVTDGPFSETKELIAGFWILQLRNIDEAIAWVKRVPNPDNEDWEIEIRQIGELEEFGDAFGPELQAQEERIRAGIPPR